MKICNPVCLLAALAAFGSFLISTNAGAATMDCSGTKKSKAAPYKEVIRPADRPITK